MENDRMIPNASIFAALVAACRRNPAEIAISSEHKMLAFEALLDHTAAIAEFFRKYLAPQIVYIALPGGQDFTTLQFGIMASGNVAVPIPNKLTPYEVSAYFRILPPDIVCLPSLAESKTLIAALSNSTPLIITDDVPERSAEIEHPWSHLKDITQRKAAPFAASPPSSSLPQDTRMVQFTSGSTGLPKAILLTEANILGNQNANADHLRPFTGQHFLCPIPQYHAMGNAVVFEHLLSGSSIHLANSFLHGEHFKRLAAYRCTGILASPNYFRMLLRAKRFEPDSLPHLAYLTIGTDWIDRTLLMDLRDRFPDTTLFCRYGLSEAVGPIAYYTIAPGQTPSGEGALGNLLPGIQMKKMDFSPSTSAEAATPLRVKSVSAADWQLASKATLTPLKDDDGFLNTGDLVRKDSEGRWIIVGRETEFIKVNGFRVNPYEIEELLRNAPGIRDAVVVGVPDPISGHRIVACLDPEGKSLSEKDLIAFCIEHLSPLKIPTQFIADLAIPKTGAGKPARHKLAQMIASRLTNIT